MIDFAKLLKKPLNEWTMAETAEYCDRVKFCCDCDIFDECCACFGNCPVEWIRKGRRWTQAVNPKCEPRELSDDEIYVKWIGPEPAGKEDRKGAEDDDGQGTV